MKPRRKMSAPVRRKPSVKRSSGGGGGKIRAVLLKSWWVLRGAAAGTLTLALLYGAWFGTGRIVAMPALAVKNIEVTGCRGIASESIVRMSGVAIGQPLLRVNLAQVRERVARHPAVKDAAVVRELPDTLKITVTERTPAAGVLDRDFALVDREGVVLSHPAVYTDEYPIITGITPIADVGKVIMEALPALRAMEELSSTGFPGADSISEINTGEERLLVSLTGSGTLLVLPRGDVQGALLRLARFIQAGLFDTGAPGYDLRFKGRVVVMPERTVSNAGEGYGSLAGG